MKRIAIWTAMTLLLAPGQVLAQHSSTAYVDVPIDFRPIGYQGDVFTGTVASTDEQTNSVTLEYHNKRKTETFVGTLGAGCEVWSRSPRLQARDIPLGTVVIAWYMPPMTVDVNGTKEDRYRVFAVAFEKWAKSGPAPERHQSYQCSLKQTR